MSRYQLTEFADDGTAMHSWRVDADDTLEAVRNYERDCVHHGVRSTPIRLEPIPDDVAEETSCELAHATRCLPLMVPQCWQTRRWERGTRYYTVLLHQDLWGQFVITRIYGHRHSELGRILHLPQPSFQAACETLAAIERRRKARRYRLIDYQPIDTLTNPDLTRASHECIQSNAQAAGD